MKPRTRKLAKASAILLVASLAGVNDQSIGYACFLVAGAIMFTWGIGVTWHYVGIASDFAVAQGRIAATPLPSITELRSALQTDLQREPTIEEISALQQIYATQKNDASKNVALTVGAFLLGEYEIGRIVK